MRFKRWREPHWLLVYASGLAFGFVGGALDVPLWASALVGALIVGLALLLIEQR